MRFLGNHQAPEAYTDMAAQFKKALKLLKILITVRAESKIISKWLMCDDGRTPTSTALGMDVATQVVQVWMHTISVHH